MDEETTATAEQTTGLELDTSHTQDPDDPAATAQAPGEEGTPTEATESGDETEPIAGLDPAIQESINKRIGKEIAKRKALETELAQLKGNVAAPSTTDEAFVKEAVAMGIHPDYLTKDELAVVKQDQELSEASKWLLDHWDGYEGTAGNQNDPAFTASEIRARYHSTQNELSRIKARAYAIQDRVAQEMQNDLAEVRKRRSEKSKLTTELSKAAHAPQKTMPPKVPLNEQAGGRPPISVSKPAKADFGATFKNKGASKASLQAAYAVLM
jgi:hypothetical protein